MFQHGRNSRSALGTRRHDNFVEFQSIYRQSYGACNQLLHTALVMSTLPLGGINIIHLAEPRPLAYAVYRNEYYQRRILSPEAPTHASEERERHKTCIRFYQIIDGNFRVCRSLATDSHLWQMKFRRAQLIIDELDDVSLIIAYNESKFHPARLITPYSLIFS